MSLKSKIIIGYFILVAVISCFAIIGVYERNHLQKIENSVHEIRRVRQDINIAHRHVARLATLGEGVIGWEAADSARYHALRLRTDSLLQTLKPHCTGYVRPGQIDTLCSLLADKEVHLLHIMEAM